MAPSTQSGCGRVLDLLEAYVDGELAPGEVAAVERHLAACDACAEEHQLALAVKGGLRSLPRPACPPAVLEEVARRRERGDLQKRGFSPSSPGRALRGGLGEEGWGGEGRVGGPPLRGPRRVTRWVRLAAAAAILAAVTGGLYFLMQPSRSEIQTAEVERATYEARLALAYIGEASRKAGLSVREEVFEERVVAPTARSLSRMLPLSPRDEP